MNDDMSFDDPRRPVWLASDLDTLDQSEIEEGYKDGLEDFPCSGNRSRAYWHGWQNGMVDKGRMKSTPAMAFLARDFIARNRVRKALTASSA
jgi:hypothetical protein